jgi:hypothetical protein
VAKEREDVTMTMTVTVIVTVIVILRKPLGVRRREWRIFNLCGHSEWEK